MQGKISGLISLNCVDERSCYMDKCIQKVLNALQRSRLRIGVKNLLKIS